MNKELERLKDYITSRPVTRYERSALEEHRYVEIDTIAITQIVNYIDNSIPKEIIEKKIKEAKQELKKEQEKAHWKNIAMLMKLDTKIEALQDLLEEK